MSVFKLVFKYKINVHCKNSERWEDACPSFRDVTEVTPRIPSRSVCVERQDLSF